MTIAALAAARFHAGPVCASSSIAARDDVDQFGHFATLVGLVAGCNRIGNAICRMVGKNFLLGAPQSGTDGRKLGHDIDAVSIGFDHTRQTAYLTFDPTQAFEH